MSLKKIIFNVIYNYIPFVELVEKRRKEVHDEIKQIETRFMNDIKAIEEGKIVKEEDFDLEFIDEHKIYTNSDNAENNENRTTKVKEEIRHSSEENEPILKSTIGNNFQKHTVNWSQFPIRNF